MLFRSFTLKVGTIVFGLMSIGFLFLFYDSYLSCAIRYGFNSEGRCFDSSQEVVYESDSSFWGAFAAVSLILALGCYMGRRRMKAGDLK